MNERNETEIMELFESSGALLKGHFLLSSGKHSDRYIQCARVLQYPRYAERVCRVLADRYADVGVQAVIGPATGGIILAYELARLLGTRALFMEREQDKMLLKRGFSIEQKENILVAEDVITTGGSIKEVLHVSRLYGGNIVGAGVMVDRSGGEVDLGVRTEVLLKMEVQAFSPEECPLCAAGVPLEKPGSREIG